MDSTNPVVKVESSLRTSEENANATMPSVDSSNQPSSSAQGASAIETIGLYSSEQAYHLGIDRDAVCVSIEPNHESEIFEIRPDGTEVYKE